MRLAQALGFGALFTCGFLLGAVLLGWEDSDAGAAAVAFLASSYGYWRGLSREAER